MMNWIYMYLPSLSLNISLAVFSDWRWKNKQEELKERESGLRYIIIILYVIIKQCNGSCPKYSFFVFFVLVVIFYVGMSTYYNVKQLKKYTD